MSEIRICLKCKRDLPSTKEYYYENQTYSVCKECRKQMRNENANKTKDYNQNYYQKNKDSIKEYSRNYHHSNKEEIQIHQKEYRMKNAANLAEYRKKYEEDNKKDLVEYRKNYYLYNKNSMAVKSRLYYSKNKEKVTSKIKDWKCKNPEKLRIQSQRRKSIKRHLESTFTNEQWQKCIEHFENKCAYCGEVNTLQQDHFVALSKGGEYTKNNIVPACGSCNNSKHGNDFFDWYLKQSFYSKRRERYILKYLNYSYGLQQLMTV